MAVARARAGDRSAYEVLVARYTMAAHRTAFLLGAGSEAEDVVQEAFVKAFRALPRFREGAPFRPWLLRIVTNEARNLHRSAGRRAALAWRLAATAPDRSAADGGSATDPEEHAISAQQHAALLQAVAALSEKERLVVTCRYFLELSEAETSQVLGWPLGSVKSRLSRALARLRPAVPAAAPDPPTPARGGPGGERR